MSQHFLLSAAARTLSLTRIMRMTDDEARDTFKRIRWSENNAEPFCPHWGCLIVYTLTERRRGGSAALAGASSRSRPAPYFTLESWRFAITSP